MRIVIASTYVPFVKGGGTMIVDSLEAELRKRGYLVDTVRIPLRSAWFELPEQILALRCMDLTQAAGNRIDRLITIRYPSYALYHPNKVNWFIHHHRGAYDLWGTTYQDIPNTPDGLRTRELIISADTHYIREAQYTYTNSKVVAHRLQQFNHIDADAVVYPPLPDSEAFHAGEYQPYFLYTARLTPIKRQVLAIEAMLHTRSSFKLVLAGAPDVDSYRQTLEKYAEQIGVADRVQFMGWVTDAQKIELTANALGVLYIPYDEDSYGYPTLEAFHSHKAVITLRDSGGTDEVIEHGWNGLIVDATPQALGEAMEQLWGNPVKARAMGEHAAETLLKHRIDWDHVIERMTA